jgi:hypothetical protein
MVSTIDKVYSDFFVYGIWFIILLGVGTVMMSLWVDGNQRRREMVRQKKGKIRNVNTFIREVVQEEGGAKSIDIAQGKELLRRINEKLNGEVYKLIRTIEW